MEASQCLVIGEGGSAKDGGPMVAITIEDELA